MVKKISGDTRARVLFSKLKEQIREVEVFDQGIHFDVDTVEDYQRLAGFSFDKKGGRQE